MQTAFAQTMPAFASKLQELFGNKNKVATGSHALISPASSSENEDEVTVFSLATIKATLDELSKSSTDQSTVREVLDVLYNQKNALEDALSEVEGKVDGSKKESISRNDTLSGFDCSLEELETTLQEVRETLELWLEKLSSGPPEIEASDIVYDEKDLVGEGAFGKVYRGQLYGSTVAVKIPIVQGLESSELADFRQEVSVLRKIFHPNVVLVLGASTEPGRIRMVFELMKTSLKTLLTDRSYNYAENFTPPKRVKLIKDIAKGIAWLHSGRVRIVHRDLKLDNLMVDAQFNAKVGDFGLSMFKTEETVKDTIRGNLLYRAPELMAHSRGKVTEVEFTEKIDVYAFAILAWEIFLGEEWYPEYPYDEPARYRDFICAGSRPPFESNNARQRYPWPPLLIDLIKLCWAQEPADRPSMAEAVAAIEGIEYEMLRASVAEKISSVAGREFWLRSFAETSVSWRQFSLMLSRAARLPVRKLGAVRRLLCCRWETEVPEQSVNDFVDIKRFNAVQSCFGPFFLPSLAPTIVLAMRQALGQSWFHADITRQVAEDRLKITHRQVGTFLVRMSVSQADVPFVVSYVSAGKGPGEKGLHHLKIRRLKWDEPRLSMDGKVHNSLIDCVQVGMDRNILTEPCDTSIPCSPYQEHLN